MELHWNIASICIYGLLCLNFIKRTVNEPVMLSWACKCAANPLAIFNSTGAYSCSTSCHCLTDDEGGIDGGTWKCSCASMVTPQATDSKLRSSCFSSCNCSAGSTDPTAKRHFSNRGVMVILLVCTVTAGIALFLYVAFHYYLKKKLSQEQRIYSTSTNSNSLTNLISCRYSSFFQSQIKSDAKHSTFTEVLRGICSIFRGNKQTILGAITQFTFFELEQATGGFSDVNLIGQGGSSNVYCGKLLNGKTVAVKKLKTLDGSAADSFFLTEIELISRLNHCHVAPLLGYCFESHSGKCERLLVFEYMSNGNLREWLDAKHGRAPLCWFTRVRIALGAARGLEYLHEAAAPRILHRDIKSTNILLDENLKSKITDLGMAKCLKADDHPSCSTSPARMLGTFGYFAPEYAIVGKASLKSDVFSYGVVILELITGRQPIHKSAKGEESLVMWATALLNDNKLIVTELPDPLLQGNFPAEEMQLMAHVARECLQWDPDSRPTMTEIVQILSTIAPEKPSRNFRMEPSRHCIKTNGDADQQLTFDTSSNAHHDSFLPARLNEDTLERVYAHSSLPPTINENPYGNSQKSQEVVLSTEQMQQLILLSSPIKSFQSPEEDVDLTEPRFESFL
ncbi:hypothetical protein HPP92_003356 [Vanilla planifolia]|uniref:non-specific serine/threonine protein kinase n=1 Tax=Vanilla planifolia TaxID=51239 RepID=A0A835RU92_VANPL|nr:hypothetical protein HPP92_003356 [Vanilla planifolia]